LVIKVAENPDDINPKGGFNHYGLVKNNYILLKGSIAGSSKRLVRLNFAIRPHKRKHSQNFEIEHMSIAK
jgi:large subunit ribosomal protein L3